MCTVSSRQITSTRRFRRFRGGKSGPRAQAVPGRKAGEQRPAAEELGLGAGPWGAGAPTLEAGQVRSQVLPLLQIWVDLLCIHFKIDLPFRTVLDLQKN